MVIGTTNTSATLMVQTSHLNVLNLGLVDTRTLSREELLLMLSQDTVLNLVRLGCGALRLGKLLMNDKGLAIDSCSLLYFDIGVPKSRLLSRDASSCIALVVMLLNMHHSR